jgi:hypothetical protein
MKLSTLKVGAVLLLCLVAGACGNSKCETAESCQTGASGHGGSGGQGGTGGQGGSGGQGVAGGQGGSGGQGGAGGSPAACNAESFARDLQGGACDGQEGASCGDGCISCNCSQSKWVCAEPACVVACPATAPKEGDPCSPCCAGVCSYPCGTPGLAAMASWSCVHPFGSSAGATWHAGSCQGV